MVKNTITTLNLDLDNKSSNITTQNIDSLSLEEKIGGFGKAVHDIGNYLSTQSPITDAYDPRNMLCIDLGFLTGTKLMTARRTIFSGLSPLKTSNAGTNGIFYSTASGENVCLTMCLLFSICANMSWTRPTGRRTSSSACAPSSSCWGEASATCGRLGPPRRSPS